MGGGGAGAAKVGDGEGDVIGAGIWRREDDVAGVESLVIARGSGGYMPHILYVRGGLQGAVEPQRLAFAAVEVLGIDARRGTRAERHVGGTLLVAEVIVHHADTIDVGLANVVLVGGACQGRIPNIVVVVTLNRKMYLLRSWGEMRTK